MTCTINTIKPRKLSESLIAAGDEIQARKVRLSGRDKMMQGAENVFICGKDLIACTYCGAISTSLCDEPIGKGKTCDLPLCDECKTSIGDDLDLCKIHSARHKG